MDEIKKMYPSSDIDWNAMEEACSKVRLESEEEQKERMLRAAIRDKLGRDFDDDELKRMNLSCHVYAQSGVSQYILDGECILQIEGFGK